MKKISALVAILLAIIMFSAPVACAVSELRINSVAQSTPENLDYSAPYAPRAYVSPSDLLTHIISDIEGDDISPVAAEAEFLDNYFSEYLVYSKLLPASLVSVSYDGTTVAVTASAYSYTSESGRPVSFMPICVIENGVRHEDLEYTDGAYTVSFESDTAPEDVSVSYCGSLSLPKSTVNTLLNFAFNEAERAVSSSESLARYTAALSEYRTYLRQLQKYELDLEAYEQYLEAKAIYDAALARYQENQAQIREYTEQKAKYDAYVTKLNEYNSAMVKYNSDYAEYEVAFEKYREYISNVSVVRASLNTMESLFTDGSRTRCLYEALQNAELVVMLEKYQSILTTNFGVPKSDITQMRQSSDKLNSILQGYAAQRDISEEAAFTYYKANYSEICRLFNMLYDKMSSILTPTIYNLVCGKLELEYGAELGQYKKWRVKNVLSHIYRICLCLDDARLAEETWSFYADTGDPHVYYFSDLLDQSMIISDTNSSDPSGISWVAPVELPTSPVMPTKPTEVTKPVPPVELPRPIEPVAVDRPTEPVAVDEPTEPDDIDYSLLLSTIDIQVALSSGELSRRDEITSDTFIFDGIDSSVTVRYSPEGETRVTSYSADGEILSVGDSASALPSPSGYSDLFYNYSFSSWSLSPYELISVPQTLAGSICVYPIYTATPRTYNVTFSVGGITTQKQVAAGQIPTYDDIDTKKASDSLYDYTFSTWAPALRPARSDMTYSAQYTATDRIFKVTFDFGDRQIPLEFTRGEFPSCPITPTSFIKDATLYEFSSWDKSFSAVVADTTYTAVYKKTPLASAEGVQLTVTEGVSDFTLSGNGTLFDISALLKLARKSGKSINVLFSGHGASLAISAKTVETLVTYGAKNIVLLCEGGDEGRGIGFSLSDSNGRTLSIDGDFRLRFGHSFATAKNVYVRSYYTSELYNDDVTASITENDVDIVAEVGSYYKPIKKFTLSVSWGEFGSAYSDASLLAEGEKIPIHIRPNSNYVCGAIILKNNETLEETVLDSPESAVMPAYDATLHVTFVPLEFTVTFIYHGNTEVFKYKLGDTPIAPQIPLSFTEGGLFYTFIGWSSPVTTVSGVTTYTAKYYSVRIEEASVSGDTGNALKTVFIRFGIPAIIIFVALVSLTTVSIVLGVKRRKKKRAADGTNTEKKVKKKKDKNDG